jgi:hypothetical protein
VAARRKETMVKGKYNDLASIVRIPLKLKRSFWSFSTTKIARDSVSALEAELTNSYPRSYPDPMDQILLAKSDRTPRQRALVTRIKISQRSSCRHSANVTRDPSSALIRWALVPLSAPSAHRRKRAHAAQATIAAFHPDPVRRTKRGSRPEDKSRVQSVPIPSREHRHERRVLDRMREIRSGARI